MKKVLSVVLVMLCALALFANGQNESTTQASTVLKGPGNVTLKRLGYNAGFDVNTNYMVPVMKEITGYDVEYFALPAQNADEKLLMEVASGKDYDIVNLSVDQWRTLVSNGALMPLNDLLEEYGQDILKGNTDDVWNALSDENGNIYDKGFFDLIIKLNHTVNYLENSFEHRQGDSRQEELLIQIEKLNQGVIDLWQYLK